MVVPESRKKIDNLQTHPTAMCNTLKGEHMWCHWPLVFRLSKCHQCVTLLCFVFNFGVTCGLFLSSQLQEESCNPALSSQKSASQWLCLETRGIIDLFWMLVFRVLNVINVLLLGCVVHESHSCFFFTKSASLQAVSKWDNPSTFLFLFQSRMITTDNSLDKIVV